ncbi:MAG TPA: transposase [Phycisphaerae bacterium]|nr:transposase [Phycisphaerae bacterium]
MPRTARASVGGVCYHVINRGNGRAKVFHKPADFDAFVALLAEAATRVPVRVVGYCLMPNHFPLVLWPRHDGDLSRFMQWLLTAHVRRYHRHYRGSGHVWQGRFKAFPIQQDAHLLTVLRYVERNALRAGLVKRAERWAWSSVRWWRERRQWPPFLHEGPVDRGRRWVVDVNRPMTKAEEESLRRCVNRGTP